jgi:hypothetical protein
LGQNTCVVQKPLLEHLKMADEQDTASSCL